jgi:YVTN family beta-propeller protein
MRLSSLTRAIADRFTRWSSNNTQACQGPPQAEEPIAFWTRALRPQWLLAMVCTFALTSVQASPDGQVFSADERGASLTRILLEDGQRLTLDLSISPHNVQASADGRYLMAVGERSGADHGHGKKATPGFLQLFQIDEFQQGMLAEIAVEAHPAHVVSDLSDRYAFVTNAGANTVSVVDLQARKSIASIATGKSPHGLRLSPDGKELYVANVQDGSVSVLDVSARKEVARIAVGKAPVQVGFTPDGKRVFVSLRDENSVAVIDTQTRKVLAKVAVGRLPIQVHATPDGRWVLVANEGSKAAPDNRVSVIDSERLEVVATYQVGQGAHGVALDDSGRFAFVTNIHDDSLSVIDLQAGKVFTTYATGRGPNGVTWAPTAQQDERTP